MNEIEVAAGLPPTPHYRYAEVIGDRLYVAGQVPQDSNGVLVSGGVDAQAAQCLANLFTLVDAHGFGRADIRHLTIYVAGDADDLRVAWAAVADAFDRNVPPATLLGVRALGYDGQLVEVDAHVERAPR